MGQYWLNIVKAAVWRSLLVFYDEPLKGLLLTVLGIVITTVIVWIVRSKEAFTEHAKSNVAIPIAGGICIWAFVFAYQLVAIPSDSNAELKGRLTKTEFDVRSAVIAQQSAERRTETAEHEKNVTTIVHGACKLTADQINPARSQPACPNGMPPTFRDRVLAINAHLTEGDRNRFSDALSEFEQSLNQGQSIFYKLTNEGGTLERERQDGSIVKDFPTRQKALTDIATEAWKYQKEFPALRNKWAQLFGDQTQYIFGGNPDNEGPNALINAAEGYRNFIDFWKVIQNKDNRSVLTLLTYANNDFQSHVMEYSKWHGGSMERLGEMRNSIR